MVKIGLLALSLFCLVPSVMGEDFVLTKSQGKNRKAVADNKFATKDQTTGLDSFYDKDVNYAKFSGRITDRDKSSNLMKVSSENSVVRFFRAGDKINFHVATMRDRDPCVGYIRSSEKGYFTIYAEDLTPCWGGELYFRRGTVIIVDSRDLSKRVEEASLYRVALLRRKKDYFNQLNRVNHFIWAFDQEKMKLAAEYDKKIMELTRDKERALDALIGKKGDYAKLQRELAFQLDELEKDLDFYRIERTELYVDRWHQDKDLGLPVAPRPQELKD